MQHLDQAIAALYAAFADACAPVRIEGCPCCADRKTAPSLLHRPLHEIPLDDLGRYAFSAITTVGSETDYLYFLPRIVEIAATAPSRGPDIPVTAGKIAATGFASWPPRRREALLAVIDCTVEHLLATAEHDALDDWLCACARLGIDLRPHLARIEARPDAVLACFTVHAQDIGSGRLRRGYWEYGNAGHDQLLEWLRSPTVRRVAAEAFGMDDAP
jgi:hypothetical protein